MKILTKFDTFETFLTLNEIINSDNARDINALNTFRKCFTLITTNYKFFAELLFNLKIIEAHANSGVDTMATDGKAIIYNPKFVNSLTEPEVLFVILHEIMHNANLHFTRMGGRAPKLWNIAADYAINIQLDDMINDMKSTIVKTPTSALKDEKYRHMSAEQIYDEIYDNLSDDQKEKMEKGEQGDGGDGGDGQGDGKFRCPHCSGEITDIKGNMVGKPNNGVITIKCPHCTEEIEIDTTKSSGGGGSGGGSDLDMPVFCPLCDEEIDDIENHIHGSVLVDGKVKATCPHCGGDFEMEIGGGSGSGDGGEQGDQDPKEGEGGGGAGTQAEADEKKDPIGSGDIAEPGSLEDKGETIYEGNVDLDKMTKNEVTEKWKRIRVDAAANSRGTGSASFDRWIRKTTKPKVDWKTELKKFVSQIFSKMDYANFNKRFLGRGLRIPGPKPVDTSIYDNVVIAIDTSGSINDVTLGKFGAELETLFKRHQIKKCHIIWCDSEIKSVQTFDLKKEKFDLTRLVPKGGGGTSFVPPFVWVQQNVLKKGKEPAFFIYFTDAYGDAPLPGQYGIKRYLKRILWIVTDNEDASNLTYGKKIYLDKM